MHFRIYIKTFILSFLTQLLHIKRKFVISFVDSQKTYMQGVIVSRVDISQAYSWDTCEHKESSTLRRSNFELLAPEVEVIFSLSSSTERLWEWSFVEFGFMAFVQHANMLFLHKMSNSLEKCVVWPIFSCPEMETSCNSTPEHKFSEQYYYDFSVATKTTIDSTNRSNLITWTIGVMQDDLELITSLQVNL